MAWLTGGVVAVATVAVGVLARRRSRSRSYTVTIDRPPAELAPGGRLPPAVASLGSGVAVTLRAAPDGRGTELVVRLREGEPSVFAVLCAWLTGEDRHTAVRSALRQAKQLAEAGGTGR
ncbi:hypothetical protein [Plantactinospora sonchi]